MAGFLPGNGWSPAKAQASFGTAMVAKQTLPLSVTYVTPNVTAVSPGVWFIDFGTEVMAGLSITVTNGAKGQQLDLQLGEELTGPHTILVPMRTVSVCWVPAAPLLLSMAFAFDAICPSRMPCDPCKTGMAAARHRDIGWMRTLRLLMQLYVCFMFAGQHLPEHFYAGGRDLPPGTPRVHAVSVRPAARSQRRRDVRRCRGTADPSSGVCQGKQHQQSESQCTATVLKDFNCGHSLRPDSALSLR